LSNKAARDPVDYVDSWIRVQKKEESKIEYYLGRRVIVMGLSHKYLALVNLFNKLF
jgi:hypothetical protein